MRNVLKVLLIGVAFLIAAPALVFAGESRATAVNILGEAKVLKKGESDWKPLEKSAILTEGDSVRTAADSMVTLELVGNNKTAEVVVKPESEFSFQTFQHDETKKEEHTQLNVDAGSVLVKAEKLVGDSKFEVKTPTSIVGIRGTVFEVQVSKS